MCLIRVELLRLGVTKAEHFLSYYIFNPQYHNENYKIHSEGNFSNHCHLCQSSCFHTVKLSDRGTVAGGEVLPVSATFSLV